jgi:VanZ family protein
MNTESLNIFFVLLGFGVGLVGWGLLCPVQSLPECFRNHDKILHAVAFAGLAVLTSLWLPEANMFNIWVALTLAGLAGEVAQNFTGQRKFCWRDALANGVGAAAGLILIAPISVL